MTWTSFWRSELYEFPKPDEFMEPDFHEFGIGEFRRIYEFRKGFGLGKLDDFRKPDLCVRKLHGPDFGSSDLYEFTKPDSGIGELDEFREPDLGSKLYEFTKPVCGICKLNEFTKPDYRIGEFDEFRKPDFFLALANYVNQILALANNMHFRNHILALTN